MREAVKKKWAETTKIIFEPWKTPLSRFDRLLYIGTLALSKIHFILEIGDGSGKLAVVTLPANMPFRIVDETNLEDLWHRLEKRKKKGIGKRTCTLKLWGSPFSKEIEAGGIFYHGVPEKNQCEYLIETNSESPGFLTAYESNIEFRFFDSLSADKLMKRLIDEDMAWLKKKRV